MPFLSPPETRLPGLRFAGLFYLAALGAVPGALAAVSANDGFDPNANGIVNAVVVQPDGKVLMGGYFTQLHPYGGSAIGAAYIGRLNHDGTVDTSFSPNANGVVRAVVLQPNGQILVGGQFTTMQPTGGGAAVPANYAARLNSDGTVDSTFNPNANGVVYAFAYQPNGQVVIGGSFTTVQPSGSPSPVTRNHIARFNADGTLDTSFDPNADKTVLSLALQANGQIVVGGGFATLQPNGAVSPTNRSCAARINSDGSIDAGFDPEPNGSVSNILVLPSGQIMLGGEFITVQPNGSTGAIQCDFLARLNTDGSLDTSYIINPLQNVTAIAYQPDGKLIIGGTFSQVFPENNLSANAVPYVARINTDGSVDGTFIPNPNQAVNAIAVQPDGDVILGGYFTSLQPLDASTSVPRNFIARVNSFGVPDATVAPDSVGTVFASAPLSNGQMLVGGSFLSIGGVTRSYLARLNADGSLDTAFTPTINGPVQAIVLQPNGQILIAGSFNGVDGVTVGNVARLNPDGTIDGAFNPNVNSNVIAMALTSNGQILIGGGFTLLAPNGSTTGYAVSDLARLNADGTGDLTFNPSPNGGVFAIQVLSDGRILIGGGFTAIGTATRGYIARMLPTGLLDTQPFDPEANLPVYAIAVQPNGQIVIGGSFTALLPQTGKAGAAVTTTNTPYGAQTVLPAPGTDATTPIYVNHLARLNTDGTLDTTFFPDPDSDVLTLALQSDGSILMGGLLTSFAPNGATTGIVRNYIGKVGSNGAIDPTFNPNANALVNTISLLPNGNILVGGTFTTMQPDGAAQPSFVNHVAVLNPNGTLSPAFTAGTNPTLTGQVRTFAQQPNGPVIFGGSFTALGGAPAPYLARLNGDASPDTTFNSAVDGPVNSIAVLPNGASTEIPSNSGVWLESDGRVRHSYSASSNGEVVTSVQQPNGQVLIGGLFTNFAGVSGLANLVRLNVDGTVDTTFNPTPSGVVSAIVVQPDGKIVIGGGFTNVDGVNNAYIARLNSDGTLDTAFAPQPNLQVLALALAPNGQILVGGDFTTLVPTSTSATVSNVGFVARLNTDGTVDSTFNPDLNGPAYAIIVLPSGQIIIAGSFTTITPNAGPTVYDVQDLARLNANGTVDTGFYPDPNSPISAAVALPNGQLVVGGTFTAFERNANIPNVTPDNPVDSNFIARINTDGTVDTSFDPNPNGGLTAIALQPNGQIVFGGNFTTVQPNEKGVASDRSDIARVNSDGSIDPSFDPSLNGVADTISVLSDGSLFVGGNFTEIQVGGAVLIGGSFAHVGGTSASNVARLNADGSYDSSFVASADGPVNAIVPLFNGTAYIGGSFANVEGQPRADVARLDADGTFDSSFNAAVNGTVNAIAQQPDGQVILGGSFTNAGGQNSPNLVRVGPAGTPDASFAASVNGTVDAVVVQPNGQVVIGGSFTNVDGLPVGGVARVNPDGSVDTSFNPNSNGTVQAVTQQVDGTFYLAGTFTMIGGQAIPFAAHVFSDGAVDTGFVPAPNAVVNAVMVQPDGKVFLGGGFTVAGGLSRIEIARFTPPSIVTQSISVSADQSTLTWTRTGGAPAFSAVGFEETTDGTHWVSVGQGTTADGMTWQLTGVPPTGSTLFLVRATGVSPSSQFSSSGLDQALYLANSSATPVVNSVPVTNGTSGTPLAFTVTATQSPTSFSASGLPPGLAINPATGVISGTPIGTGTYSVVVTVGNTSGSTVSALTITIGSTGATRFSPASTSAANRLLNLSSRAELNGNQVLIAGFVISGTGPKSVLLRAVGPGLKAFNVPGVMLTPELQLYSSTGALMNDTTAWGGSSALSAEFAQVGAFALQPTSADSALSVSLQPGSYTIHVFDHSGTGGVVLAEIYDASASPMTAPQRLINISARGTVSPGAGALIGGFVISGSSTKSVLIRGIGPGLSEFGVADAIADPVLSVFDENGTLVAQNFAWSKQTITGADQATISAQDLTTTESSVGAFALSALSPDTALIANLPPGAYTFQVTSASEAMGEALGEVYELP